MLIILLWSDTYWIGDKPYEPFEVGGLPQRDDSNFEGVSKVGQAYFLMTLVRNK